LHNTVAAFQQREIRDRTVWQTPQTIWSIFCEDYHIFGLSEFWAEHHFLHGIDSYNVPSCTRGHERYIRMNLHYAAVSPTSLRQALWLLVTLSWWTN
jgi:hypothetical protein